MIEKDIRPKELFEHYLALCRRDAEKLKKTAFVDVECPGCGGGDARPQFEKDGFKYVICKSCGSLYCSPRPTVADLNAFYADSLSSRYWSETFFPAVAEARRKQLFEKKARQIYLFLNETGFVPRNICDAGAGYGILLEELRTFYPEAELAAIEPNPSLASTCRSKGFATLATTVEHASRWSSRFDLAISQEVLEHAHSPYDFTRALSGILKGGGYCLTTCLGYEGFDVLSLQDKSNSVFPPHHLNFLSISGFEMLFRRVGFHDIVISTPGELDIDIVANSPFCTEFVRVLVARGEEASRDFQNLLQKHRLSSHVWIYAQK